MSVLLSPNVYKEILQPQLQLIILSSNKSNSNGFGFGFDRSKNEYWKQRRAKKTRDLRAFGFWPELSKQPNNSNNSVVELVPIQDCEHFDQILAQAKELSQPVVVDWMAAWCRKCIFLKPKVEKLAGEYDTKVKFYFVDVNKVPQTLVKRGNISKMPTIQLWKDGEMKAEVIGGHKAWLVIEEIREMVNKFV